MDLADAHVLALEHLLAAKDNLILNLGSGAGYSVNEVIEAARRVTGESVRTVNGPRRAGDPPVLVADTTRAGELLGWHPIRAALEDQIGDAWRWHQKHFGATT